MKKVAYLSLDEIRADKVKARRLMKRSFDDLRGDVSNCFMPADNLFLNSSNRWMNWIGYGITAYKTFKTFRSVFSFIARLM